jgi:hypothetical protein
MGCGSECIKSFNAIILTTDITVIKYETPAYDNDLNSYTSTIRITVMPSRPFSWAQSTTFNAAQEGYNKVTAKLLLQTSARTLLFRHFSEWVKRIMPEESVLEVKTLQE